MLCALIVQMPSTATLCSCFSRLTSQLAKSSLDDLGGSENQLDPASALLYEAFADIADCFTAVSLANNIPQVQLLLTSTSTSKAFLGRKLATFKTCLGTSTMSHTGMHGMNAIVFVPSN